MIDRQAVRENAMYLRNVRPIDPDEIADYVEGRPHPAVVRQTLREEAFDLGLLERDDGTFVPVDEGPVPLAFDGVDAFPEAYHLQLEDLLIDRYGPDWHRGESGDRLRETVRRLKEDYYRQRDVEYDEDVAAGYAIYHLPDYYAAVQYVLAELARPGLLPRRLRVVDVGAGVGGPALGVHDFLPADAVVDYHAVEPSPAADVLSELLPATGRNFHATIHRETAEAFEPASVGDVDLLLFGNVLNELADPVSVVERYVDALASDGSVVALEPADRNTAIGLREVERTVEGYEAASGTLGVFAPEVRLWPTGRPTDRGWTFDVRPDLAVPAVQRRLDEPAGAEGEFVNVDVQYAYGVWRLDGARKYDVTPDATRWAKMAEIERHVTNRVDLLAVKLSHDLAAGGNPLFKLGDGSQSVDHYGVLTRETATNADLRTADYGDLLSFEQVLVLWNDDEEAYNLVVDEDTFVDRVPP